MALSNQEVVDRIAGVLPTEVPEAVQNKILDHAWDILNDEWKIDPAAKDDK